MSRKVRIKDIAEKAGVSVGTVDRVIHDRDGVSSEAAAKVNAVLKEMNYHPNAIASALATNKEHTFIVIMPEHNLQAYWQEVEDGVTKAEADRRDFRVHIEKCHYNRHDKKSFLQITRDCIKKNPDGIILVPSDIETTRKCTDTMHKKNIPFILLDSYMPDLKPLAFFGLDSFNSGYFAAKMFTMMMDDKNLPIMLMRQMLHGKVASKQQANREEGFRHYMIDHYPKIKIIDLDINDEKTDDEKQADEILETFFKNNPTVRHCITLSSKAYVIGEYLLRSNRRNIHLMGYDIIPRNEECLKQGAMDFIIAQHAYRQGYYCVKTIFDAVVLHKRVNAINYMPIVLLCKENADFYQRKEL